MHNPNTLGAIFKVNFSKCQFQIQYDLQQHTLLGKVNQEGREKENPPQDGCKADSIFPPYSITQRHL